VHADAGVKALRDALVSFVGADRRLSPSPW